ncbi:uncharacterized protein LOC106069490 isoform X2 [Biomphalaria glabrata]|uniref:Uncharacterized protein LOC106069490 isoform X2 n=1 Tax=Biomphalaria glabrata TaxID=6526 RepID=A0A9W3AKN8_BIOGL|nr:uncharacterized protein LOC106069490 isoform X2 [Biomphalaria glabrata]
MCVRSLDCVVCSGHCEASSTGDSLDLVSVSFSVSVNNVLQKLKLKEPESRIKHAHKFLKEYLKSKYEGKGKILKDALLMRGPDSGNSLPSDHRLIWTALLSNTSDIDLAAHSHDQKLIQALQAEITECIECDEGWLSHCLERGLITKKEFEEIRSLRDRSGTHRGNVMLLECITRTYQFLKTFLELLWDRGLEDLVRKIDKVTYEKFLARETDGGSDDRPMRHDTVHMSGPVEGDDYAGQDNPNAAVHHSSISPLLLDPMAAFNGEVPDSLPSTNYMELPNEEIDRLINKNFTFIAENLRVYDLITGPHIFNSIIPSHVLKELKLKDPKLKMENARKFLNEYLKSNSPGKGKVLKDALLMRGTDTEDTISSDHKLIWTVLSSRTQDLDLEAHRQELYLIENLLNILKNSIDCDEDWLSDCLHRELITRNDMEEIRACRTAEGNISGNVLLLDCITKTHHFLKKFLKLLWSRELKNLVQEIDSVLYEKFEANERTASDARTMTQEIEYMSGPVPKDDYQCQGYDANEDLMHDCNSSENTSVKMYPKKEIDFNIPINDLGDGSVSSIALNDLSDGSSIALSNPSGLSSTTYTKDCYSDDEGISTSVNESISVINSAQKIRNLSTYETNLPLGMHDRAPRSLDVYNHGDQFSEEGLHRTKVPDRKTPQFGFQSTNTTAYTHQHSNIFVDKKEDDKLSDYKSNSTKPQTLKIKSIKPIDQHKTTKTPFKTSDNFKASPENKTLRELTKSAKTQEDRYRMSKIHTDLSENTRSSTSKPHSGTFKPLCQTPPNKLRAQASNDKKPSRMQDHVERPSRTPDLRNGSEKQGTMGKSTRSYYSVSSQRVQFYDCPFCKMRFISDTNLQEHIKKTCGPKGDDHLRCKKCTKMFTEKATLDRHMRECSSEPLRELTSRQDNTPAHRPTQIYCCSQCKAKFMEKDKLKSHRLNYHL